MDTPSLEIALFQRGTDMTWLSVWTRTAGDTEWTAPEPYVRISEWQAATFKPLPPEETVAEQLTLLDKAEAEARRQLAERLAQIQDMRNGLRALTHQTPESP